ncbi:Ig-like domain-containing protein [Halomonas sp. XH26]|uniref:Ig-like domain-containing protein n=1 Tax=Halomonas sp. XH26 TaxID=2557993 RepID=UPI0020A16BCB|nr:Ig-like domain-containing protein [Halomonas sp. XH26]UTA78716.1 Ig-like domain-containing protein [Halomonas sp. XH26]
MTDDNTVNAEEADGDVTVTGRVTGEYAEGDVVTLTINGNDSYTTTVNAAGEWSVNVQGSDLVADADQTIDGVIAATDEAGNVGDVTAEKVYNVDVDAPTDSSTTLIIDDVTDDNTVNAEEADGDVTVTGRVTGEYAEGDVVTLTINGNDSYTTTVNAAGEWSVNVQGSDLVADADQTIDGVIAATDEAGNVGDVTAEKVYNVDVDAPTDSSTTLIIDDVTDDNTVNAEEADGDVTVTGRVTGEYAEGDVVTLTINGNDSYTTTVNAAGEWSVNVQGSDLVADADQTIDGVIAATDEAGNVGDVTAEKVYNVDVDAPTDSSTTLIIDDVTDDNTVNAEEADGDVTVTGRVTGEYAEGDVVTLTINGNDSYTTTVNAAGEWSVNVQGSDLVADADQTIDGVIAATDEAGNVGDVTAEKVYNVDVDAPTDSSTTLIIDDVTDDNTVNAEEADGDVTVTGRVTGEYAEGDVVTLTINGNDSYTTTVNAAGEWSVNVQGSDLVADADQTIDGVIAATDEAGNVGDVTAEKVYNVDVDAPTDSSTTLIIDDVTDDNTVNAEEADGGRP